MTATAFKARSARPGITGLTWVTWRQHRLALAGVVSLLGGLGVYLLFNGLAMHHAYSSLGLNRCGKLDGPSCQSQLTAFQQTYGSWADHLPTLLMIVPGVIGVFAGAPLVARELESGTYRFAWTQSRSRIQWIVTKLLLLGVVLTALALVFSALFTWWYGPFNAITGQMTHAYEVSGLVFAARTLFGFTLGVLLGLLIRRTVPAMAATAVCWGAVVWSSMTYLRPLIRKPITTIGHPAKGPIASSHVPFNANVINSWEQNASGRHVSFDQIEQQATSAHGGTPPPLHQFQAWMTQHHYTEWVSYQPNSWFWHFQTIEATVYVCAAVLLAVATVLLLRHRAA